MGGASRAYAEALPPMPLNLIHGPPNSGRAGRIRRRFRGALDRDPVLVVPTLDDVFALRARALRGGAALGGSVMTFGGLFREVATARRRAPGRRADARPAPAGGLGGDRARGGTGSGRCGAPPPGRASRSPSSACSTSCRRRARARPRSRPRRADAGGLRLPRRPVAPLRRVRRGARPARPARLARHRPRGDRAAARGAGGSGESGRSSSTGSTTSPANQLELIEALRARAPR